MRVALGGDAMLGRQVARAIMEGRGPLLDDDVVAVAAEGDVFIVNLECCISDRGSRWSDPAKPFFFRAPPAAAERLAEIGVDCVTLANNHALDYGGQALLDTLGHLSAVGIACVGAGPDDESARAPALLNAGCTRLAVVGVSDHPAAFAAGPGEPGIAYADLRDAGIGWLAGAVADARRGADAVLVSPHWGPNMTVRPAPYIRGAARALLGAGATLVAGHSAHVVHGAERRVLYDLGDFIDDYSVDARLRNDLSVRVHVTGGGASWTIASTAVSSDGSFPTPQCAGAGERKHTSGIEPADPRCDVGGRTRERGVQRLTACSV